ncbi:protein tyrosine phosphatase-like protein, PTPLA domain-containing protein [Sarocladium implicatum]|nr:protein tyrosine phosphatase-like protein, PTPLA domain-containing protein [Sarocladium implicatum]
MAPPAKKTHSQSRETKLYLLAYNFNNAVLWGVILLRVLLNVATEGFAAVQPNMSDIVPFTQTLALLEIAHSAFGLVRAPIFTTVLQVFSRIFIVWFVVYPFPQVALHPAYTSMLLAWSITEVIRYAYFTVTVIGFNIPELTWLRYSTFFVLYPPGILSEAFLAYTAAVGPAKYLHEYYPYFLWAALVVYVPFSPVMYTHMMAQRRKIMKDWDTKYSKKEL